MTALSNSREIMKLLLDQGLPRSAASLLTAAGIDTVHVLMVIAQCTIDFERGAAVTVQSGRIRIRHLPLLEG
jgi:hypothetical protein